MDLTKTVLERLSLAVGELLTRAVVAEAQRDVLRTEVDQLKARLDHKSQEDGA